MLNSPSMKKENRVVFKYVAAAVAFFGVAWPNHVHAAPEWTGNVNLNLGIKELDGAVFTIPLTDEQTERGITLDFRRKDWPVNLLIGYFSSEESGEDSEFIPFIGYATSEIEDKTSELRLGLRKLWRDDKVFRPFLGAGAAKVAHERTVDSATPGVNATEGDSSDSALGFYWEAGLGFTAVDRINFGIFVSQSFAGGTVSGEDAKIGGSHFGAFVGIHW